MNRRGGFSLVELMIALTLGALMLAAALQFTLAGSQTHRLTDSMMRTQENGIAAMDILVAQLRLAGYQSDRRSEISVIPGDCLGANFAASSPCDRNTASPSTQTLLLQYQRPPHADTDCGGRVLDSTQRVIIQRFYIADLDGDGINSLYCSSFDPQRHRTLSVNVPLVDGIDALQVLYRVRSADGRRYRDLAFDQLRPLQLSRISAVSVALLVSNGLSQGNGRPRRRLFHLPGRQQPLTFNDRHLRRLFFTTVTLNNQFSGDRP